MKRSGLAKFPNSVQLFKFCQKVLTDNKGAKINDQDVGSILEFNPSDCSHWKRGEKNVKSVFSLARLSKELNVDAGLIHDIVSGYIGLDEAYFEHIEAKAFDQIIKDFQNQRPEDILACRKALKAFTDKLLEQAEFSTPPLYLPEVMRFFSFIQAQPVEMMDRLSRILKIKSGQYSVQFKKGELKSQTRMSILKDLARIILEAERAQFPELGKPKDSLLPFERLLFIADLMVPKKMLRQEMAKLDARKNLIADLAVLFWAPKSLISFQIQDILRLEQEEQAAAALPFVATRGESVPLERAL